jgi:hypothetical protein
VLNEVLIVVSKFNPLGPFCKTLADYVATHPNNGIAVVFLALAIVNASVIYK